MSITRINEFTAVEGKNDELFSFLKSLLPYITNSEGCTSCEVLQNDEDKSKFVVIEKWESIAFHQKSIEQFPKEEMRASMSLFAGPPTGVYYRT